jgi:hypothetical protein
MGRRDQVGLLVAVAYKRREGVSIGQEHLEVSY